MCQKRFLDQIQEMSKIHHGPVGSVRPKITSAVKKRMLYIAGGATLALAAYVYGHAQNDNTVGLVSESAASVLISQLIEMLTSFVF